MDEVVHQEEETFPNHVAAMEAQTGNEYQPEPAISPAPDIPADIDDAMTEHEASRLPPGC